MPLSAVKEYIKFFIIGKLFFIILLLHIIINNNNNGSINPKTRSYDNISQLWPVRIHLTN